MRQSQPLCDRVNVRFCLLADITCMSQCDNYDLKADIHLMSQCDGDYWKADIAQRLLSRWYAAKAARQSQRASP